METKASSYEVFREFGLKMIQYRAFDHSTGSSMFESYGNYDVIFFPIWCGEDRML